MRTNNCIKHPSPGLFHSTGATGRPSVDSYEPHERGYTLIELLVVIGICSMLLALTLPALHSARSTARHISCANNLRNIAIALNLHHDALGVFPSNGGWDRRQTILSKSGDLFQPFTWEIDSPIQYHWGVGNPESSPPDQPGSWAYAILPFLEQTPLHRNQTWDVVVSSYDCPERVRSMVVSPISDEYAQYQSGNLRWARTDYAANARVFANRPSCISIPSIRDGLSHTIFTGEKSIDLMLHSTQTWFWDESFFLGGSGGTQRGGFLLLPDQPRNAFQNHWGSSHSRGVPFSFGDGSVRSLSFHTQSHTMRALLTPSDSDLSNTPP
jgi:prepilin-type N-terminal cleavage/methylation domain-containing protein